MKKLFLVLSISVFIWSCNSNENFVGKKEDVSVEYWTTSSEVNEALFQAAKVISEVSNDPDVRKEIISYHSDITDGEVFVNFDELFNPTLQTRVSGSFADKFREKSNTNGRISGEISDSLALWLKENKFAIYAPYLAEDFSESDAPYTISWWDGIDTTGITPGITDSQISFSGRQSSLLAINDDYASSNPTLVIVPDDGIICGAMMRCNEGPGGGGSGGGSGSGGVTYTPRSIDCRVLNDDDIILMQMPYFRLKSNLRGWPNKNYLNMSTVVGNFTYDANGNPTASANTNQLWSNKWVSRKSAKNQIWMSSGLSFIMSNWDQPQLDLRIAVSYKKTWNKASFSGSVGVDSKKDFKVDLTANYSFEFDGQRKLFDVGFDRCSYLATNNDDLGHGLKDGLTIYSFGGNGPMEFVLKPIIK